MPQGHPTQSVSDTELLRVAARIDKLNAQVQKVAKAVALTVAERKKALPAKAKAKTKRAR